MTAQQAPKTARLQMVDCSAFTNYGTLRAAMYDWLASISKTGIRWRLDWDELHTSPTDFVIEYDGSPPPLDELYNAIGNVLDDDEHMIFVWTGGHRVYDMSFFVKVVTKNLHSQVNGHGLAQQLLQEIFNLNDRFLREQAYADKPMPLRDAQTYP